MTGVILTGSPPNILLSHMALYGLVGILEQIGDIPELRVAWTTGMQPRPHVTGQGLDWDKVSHAVQAHATSHTHQNSWINATFIDHLPGGLEALHAAGATAVTAVAHTGAANEITVAFADGTDKATQEQQTKLINAQLDLDTPPWTGITTFKVKKHNDQMITRGLMSPRQTRIYEWNQYQQARHRVLDSMTSDLDRRLAGCLGEPCYWHEPSNRTSRRATTNSHHMAVSRFDMAPTNSGAQLVTSRLVPLATSLSKRSISHIRDGIEGLTPPTDDINTKPPGESRTATGFATPRPVDSAIAWCALWGISFLPIAHRTHQRSISSASTQDTLIAPAWQAPLTPARLRTILASTQLVACLDHPPDEPARRWLADRAVRGIYAFPVTTINTGFNQELRATIGRYHPLAPELLALPSEAALH